MRDATAPRPSPPDDPPPFETIAGPLDAGLLLLCDHAANTLPARYGDLGLARDQFERHIAYDIGAGALTRALAARLAAPAVLSTFSRLLIDPNRGADDPTLVMRISDRAIIPGNARVDDAEIAHRRANYWRPYRDAVETGARAMQVAGRVPALVSIHSFTPVWRGRPRPWEAGVLWDMDDRLAAPLLQGLREGGVVAGDNEPYDGALRGDTMFDHAVLPGRPHALIEIRQDLIADEAGVADWTERLAPLLARTLALPTMREIRFYPSRVASPAQLAALRERAR